MQNKQSKSAKYDFMNEPETPHEALLAELEYAAAEAHANHLTRAEREESKALMADVRALIARARRGTQPPCVETRVAPRSRPSLLSLSRDALVQRLATLTAASRGSVQYAHNELTVLSDRDLRDLVATLESQRASAAAVAMDGNAANDGGADRSEN